MASPDQDPETSCNDPAVLETAKSLRDAWAKPGVELPPRGKVEVIGVTGDGPVITVPDTAITLDGRTLRSLELIGGSGDSKSFTLTLNVEKRDGAWYVADLNLGV
ncbi:hypothetical protein SD37_09970 [Amycolatopsis orientalis]|uniref:Uncharacterized protein n=1 Tax=Amycolatopsis orientalis TaxID=31958 RepID=A0A193BUP5_AMYOR|nr:hypothetical protein SD37_09970 [Amycolatopsis orientalis]